MAAVSEVTRVSFNPSWMGSTFSGGGAVQRSSVDAEPTSQTSTGIPPEGSYPLAPPKLAKNRYGREELLALMPEDREPPELLSIEFHEFFLADRQQPVSLSTFSETEQRLMHMGGINSAKAMSAFSQAERMGWSPPQGADEWSVERGAPPTRGYPPPGRSAFGGVPPSYHSYGRGGRGDFSADRGRGGMMPGRGRGGLMFAGANRGGVAAGAGGGNVINSRAQGLYDPRDPRDRPRPRTRTESGGEIPEGVGRGGVGRGHWASRSGGWPPTDRPEWMEEGDEQRGKAPFGGGSFDDDGRFHRSEPVAASTIDDAEPQPSGRSAAVASGNGERQKTPPSAVSQALAADEPTAKQKHGIDLSGPMGRHGKQAADLLLSQLAGLTGSRESPVDERRPLSVTNATVTNVVAAQPNGVDSPHLSRAAIADVFSQPDTLPPRQPSSLPMHATANTTPAPVSSAGTDRWFYRDPKGQAQGPFDSAQMNSWFSAGYFSMQLMVQEENSQTFTCLGELIKLHGKVPFVSSDRSNQTAAAAPKQQQQSVWDDEPATDVLMQQKLALMERIQLQKERQRAEEESLRDAQMRDLQEQVRRERDEKERKEADHLKLEADMRRVQEEAQRIREETECRLREEADQKRQVELEKQMLQARQQAAADEAERMRKLEEANARRQLQHEEQLRQQREADERERTRQQRISIDELFAPRQTQPPPPPTADKLAYQMTYGGGSANQSEQSSAAKGWNAVPAVAAVAADTQNAFPDVIQSLAEIQQQEERQFLAEQRQREQLDADRNQSMQANNLNHGAWAKSNRLTWAKAGNAECGGQANAWGKSAPNAVGGMGFWDDAPPPGSPSKQRQTNNNNNNSKKSPQSRSKQKVQTAAPAVQKSAQEAAVKRIFAERTQAETASDPFGDWLVKALRQMSTDIDADTFAAFLKGVDSPAELEDYVFGYLGDNNRSRDFLHDFRQRRSEAKSKRAEDRDNLSKASAAVERAGEAAAAATAAAAQTAAAAAARGKKKKKATARQVDLSALGFTAGADPNRLNAGGIDMDGL